MHQNVVGDSRLERLPVELLILISSFLVDSWCSFWLFCGTTSKSLRRDLLLTNHAQHNILFPLISSILFNTVERRFGVDKAWFSDVLIKCDAFVSGFGFLQILRSSFYGIHNTLWPTLDDLEPGLHFDIYVTTWASFVKMYCLVNEKAFGSDEDDLNVGSGAYPSYGFNLHSRHVKDNLHRIVRQEKKQKREHRIIKRNVTVNAFDCDFTPGHQLKLTRSPKQDKLTLTVHYVKSNDSIQVTPPPATNVRGRGFHPSLRQQTVTGEFVSNDPIRVTPASIVRRFNLSLQANYFHPVTGVFVACPEDVFEGYFRRNIHMIGQYRLRRVRKFEAWLFKEVYGFRERMNSAARKAYKEARKKSSMHVIACHS